VTSLRVVAVIAVATAAVFTPAVGVTPAFAAPSQWETFHDPGNTETLGNFCGVTGLTVENSYAVDGRFRTSTRGPDGLSYYVEMAQSTDVWTNVATGEHVVFVQPYRSAYQHVTDNSDGTLTVTVQTTGTGLLYNQDGKRIGHRAGILYHFQLLFDHAGTPKDPTDDVFLGVIKRLKTTGENLDFCSATVQAIG
jgi:hypothetical protein